jgi:hypothetical protein
VPARQTVTKTIDAPMHHFGSRIWQLREASARFALQRFVEVEPHWTSSHSTNS